MLFMIVLLIGVLTFVLFNLLLGSKKTSMQSVKTRMENLRRPNKTEDIVRYQSEKLDRPLIERLFLPMLEAIVSTITKVTPGNIYNVATEKKAMVGSMFPGSAGTFIFLWLTTAIGSACVASYYFLYLRTDLEALNAMLYVLSSFILGIYLPLGFMNLMIAKRKKLILKQLPEMLDLVCVSVQAGLSFDGALTKVTEHMKGPLVEECMKMLQEVRMGMTRRQALVNLSERCKLQEVSLFTASIIQSDRLGVALAKTLVIQSENMRERRRQNVKAQALKAPVKIILPLVLFIFPAIFIIALVPSILTMMGNLK